MKRVKWNMLIFMSVLLSMLAGCGKKADVAENGYIDSVKIEEVILEDEAVALGQAPDARPAVMNHIAKVEASGTAEKRSEKAVIDHSNTSDGYIMVQFTGDTSKRLKVQVKGPTTTYTYNLSAKQWTTFPLSDGNGNYQVSVFENIADDRYALVLATTFAVELKDEFAPFIRPNQYVAYDAAPKSVEKAKEITNGITEPLKKVEAVYDYTVKTISYDTVKAENVKSGYLPVLDTVLAEKKGICFDYAALMTGMLRSQNVPCKLIVGYAGNLYHAWISVWTDENGWVDGVIYFDGHAWHRMDPTFASSGNQNEQVMKYIGDGSNYTAKYIY